MGLTPDGEIYLEHARRILGEIEDMEGLLGVSLANPKGLLRVNATLGFGRSQVAPVISRFVRKYPEVQVQLQLSVNPPPVSDDSWDVCIRFGEPPDSRVIARYLAGNRRLLCAAPAYLGKHGTPETVKAADYVMRTFRDLPGDQFEFYGNYYNAQGAFQIGGRYWEEYAPWMYETYLKKQEANGSWDSREAGRIYGTAMMVLAFTVPYRQLPIYQRDETADEAGP